MHICPAVTGVVPHVGGPIIPPCAPTVLTGFLPQARIGDLLTCTGPPDVITSGSATVIVAGQPAARISDSTVHGGVITLGLPTVIIGDGGAARAALSAAQARAIVGNAAFPGQQNFGNCGVQSVGEIVFLATGQRLGEAPLLNSAVAQGLANAGTPGAPATRGGTSAAARRTLLQQNGVASTVVTTSQAALGTAIQNRQGVIINVDAGTLWGNPAQVGSGHAVVVTGGTFDAHGNLQTVTVNDTGAGTVSNMPAATLMNAANARAGGSQMNVTRDPVMP
ncbi:MAG TPA: PAAR domain-containing protein [Stellaceae bacterium]|nr:PAAR domain-containing protein [Stellaceae bacterium]